MKALSYFLTCTGTLLLAGMVLVTCSSNDTSIDPNPPVSTGTTTVATLDTLSNHLVFFQSDKINGEIPLAPHGNLKFNIKDTLRLGQGFYVPVRFLHDSSTHVTGVFIQVVGLLGGSLSASGYFDVPEVQDVAESDSVSEITIQFDPTDLDPAGFDLPLSFDIKIEPHDEKGQPVDGGIVPVRVEPLNDGPSGPPSSDLCGLTGGYWDWVMSYIPKPKTPSNSNDTFFFYFYNDPYKVWNRMGQIIYGCCCEDYSIYNDVCPCSLTPNASLHFSTYEQYRRETLTFYENGVYFRQTQHDYATPLPEESDFCANGGGKVHDKLSSVSYNGNWTVQEVVVPPRLSGFTTRNQLSLLQTSSDPENSGYGNGGGIILDLNCDALLLIQLDLEGNGDDLYKLYHRRNDYTTTEEDDWYDIPES